MSIEELFLRQIDSVDGNIEVIVHPCQALVSVSIGPFVWNIENADRDAVIELIAANMANPDRVDGPLALLSGEQMQVATHISHHFKKVYINSGPVSLCMHFGTVSLVIAALSEARQWQRTQQLAATGAEVASC